MKHLPTTIQEFNESKWDVPDFIFIFGEAYVDHPSFGHAIISRLLQDAGYRVAMMPLPDWKDDNVIRTFPRPKLGFLVSAGNIDSMVNHYSVNKKRRRSDSYAPNSKIGMRPDRATIVYCNAIRRVYKDIPIIIGGIEASLRRFAHYDYWSNDVRRSILEDANADILVYGMGEKAILDIAKYLSKGIPVNSLNNIKGTCILKSDIQGIKIINSFEDIKNNKEKFAKAFMDQVVNQDSISAVHIAQKQHRKYLVQNPPSAILSRKELDKIYELPYTRKAHSMYGIKGIAALNEVEFSLLSSRGCYGSCNFCSLSYHQGRKLVSRSHESLIREATLLTELPNFKGYIHDVGGPTANFRHESCDKQAKVGVCEDKQCMYPNICKSMKVDHKDYLLLLKKLRSIDGIKKVFIRSGIRFDYVMADSNSTNFINEITKNNISGRLKIAPEHVSEKVLNAMGKPKHTIYKRFTKVYEDANSKLGLNQHIEPYFISSHPGSDLSAAIELAITMLEMNIHPQQVQDFYPTPSTISTCMYYTGLDPRTMKNIYVPKGEEKRMQRALLQFRKKENKDLVIKALKKAGRYDLIGNSRKCLVNEKIKSEGKNIENKNKKQYKTSRKNKNVRNNRKSKKY